MDIGFQPRQSIAITASTTSQNVALPPGGECILVTNTDSNIVYIRPTSNAAYVATPSDIPIMPGARLFLNIVSVGNPPAVLTNIAVVAAAGTPGVSIVAGSGSLP